MVVVVVMNINILNIYDVIGDVERKKERKTPEAMENENESCLRWDLNPQHSVLQTDALPTELPHVIVKQANLLLIQ